MSALFPPRERTKTTADLRRGECKWPVGRSPIEDMSQQRFCCEPVEGEGASYCLEHANKAYGRGAAK